MSLKIFQKGSDNMAIIYTCKIALLLQELGHVTTACINSNIKKRLFCILKEGF